MTNISKEVGTNMWTDTALRGHVDKIVYHFLVTDATQMLI